jgi:hypothetical protein
MKNVSDKGYRENQNILVIFNIFSSGSRAVYEIKWENVVQPDRPQMTTYVVIWCMCMLDN